MKTQVEKLIHLLTTNANTNNNQSLCSSNIQAGYEFGCVGVACKDCAFNRYETDMQLLEELELVLPYLKTRNLILPEK